MGAEQAPEALLDHERQHKARRYARVHRRLMLVDLGVSGLYIMAWLVTGLLVDVRAWVAGLTGSPFLSILLVAGVFAAPYFVLDLPLSYYSSFVLPHRYGQSSQSLRSWVGDRVKGLIITGILGSVVLEVVYWLLRIAPDLWWLYAGGVMLLFSVLMSTLAPVLIAPLFYRFVPLENEDLVRRLLELAARARTRVQGVYRFDMSAKTRSANAAVMGLGATRRIVLGDTLLDNFTPDEIETVLAHELAHIAHRDMPVLVGFGAVLTLAGFASAHLALRWGVGLFGLDGIADPAGLPVFALAVGMIGMIASPISNAFSRWRERLADRFALEMTGKPQAFASAMARLANQNLGEADPERWVVILFHSHPPITERIAAANAYAATLT
jgi:STE24 endopeptidase